MPQGIKITNKENKVILYSVWISGVDYDEENFDDNEYDEEEDTNGDKNNDADDYEYEKMEENKLADILQEPNKFQFPHETEK